MIITYDYDIRGFVPPAGGCDLNHNEDRPVPGRGLYYFCPSCKRRYWSVSGELDCVCGRAVLRGGKWEDKADTMSKRYVLVPVDYEVSTGYLIKDTLFDQWEKINPRGVYGRSYSGEFYLWDKQTAVAALDGLNERHEARVVSNG